MIERLEVTAGAGTVIRYGGIVAWVDPSASAALISFLAQSARNLSPSPRGGRQIADHIAGVLATRDPEPHVAFAVVGPSDHGWASLLHGPVQAWDGARWLAPTPSPGWLQAIITPRPSITVSAAGTPTPAPLPDAMWDLEAGVVPGAGFVLVPSGVPGRFAVVRPVGEDLTPDIGPVPESRAATDLEGSDEPLAAATTAFPAVEPTAMLAATGPAAETVAGVSGAQPAAEPEEAQTGGSRHAGAAALTAAAAGAAVAATKRPPAPEPSTSGEPSASGESPSSIAAEMGAGTALAAAAGVKAASAREAAEEPVATGGAEPRAEAETAAEVEGAAEPEAAAALAATTVAAPTAAAPETTGASTPAAEPAPAAKSAGATGAAAVEPAAAETPVAPEPALAAVAPQPEPGPPPPPHKPRVPGPPGSLDLRAVATAAGSPLPRGGGPDQRIPGAPVVAGALCARGHLNRPGLTACARCRTPIPDGVRDQVSGTRPPLGVLVTDEGTIYRVDHGYLVGSASGRDPTVGGGLARPLTLHGSDVSGSHAELRLVDWDVLIVDRGSAAGTCIFEPGASEWARLNPYEPHVLQSGTHVAFGQRVVTFLSPWVISG